MLQVSWFTSWIFECREFLLFGPTPENKSDRDQNLAYIRGDGRTGNNDGRSASRTSAFSLLEQFGMLSAHLGLLAYSL